jgi:hypothetical protein
MTEYAREDESLIRPAAEPVREPDQAPDQPAAQVGLAERQRANQIDDVLRLQRLAGNAATTQLMSPKPGDAATAQLMPPKPGDGRQANAAGPANVAAPVSADEVVLTRSPELAIPGKLVPFRAALRLVVIDWGFAFNPAAVRLATEGKTTVMVLRWSLGWGPRPAGVSASGDLRPVEAKLALQAVTGLPGWASLAAADKTAVSSLLGGEFNDASNAVRAAVRPTFLALRARRAPDQAKVLRGLLVAGTGPAVVAEEVHVAPVTLKLTGPKLVKNHQFVGVKADAESWQAHYGDGAVVTIWTPKAPVPGFHHHSVQEAADAARYLPKKSRAALKQIVLNPVVNPKDAEWAVRYKRPNFHSYMTGGSTGIMTIYPSAAASPMPSAGYMRGTMVHEVGHTITDKGWGTDTTKGKWKTWATAMAADRVSVSAYANVSIHEDVAETIQAYESTKGTPAFNEYRAIVPHRFAILDKELKYP